MTIWSRDEGPTAETPEAKGEWEMTLPSQPNIITWCGVSDLFVDALNILLRSKRIVQRPAEYLSYVIDGGALRLPLVTRMPPKDGFKKPHWLPICYRHATAVEGEPGSKRRRASHA